MNQNVGYIFKHELKQVLEHIGAPYVKVEQFFDMIDVVKRLKPNQRLIHAAELTTDDIGKVVEDVLYRRSPGVLTDLDLEDQDYVILVIGCNLLKTKPSASFIVSDPEES